MQFYYVEAFKDFILATTARNLQSTAYPVGFRGFSPELQRPKSQSTNSI
jgi:hypothetical protein